MSQLFRVIPYDTGRESARQEISLEYSSLRRIARKKEKFIFQSENDSNDEDYARSPVLLDLDENSKQQQQKAASREANSPSSTVNQQHQGLTPGMQRRYLEFV